MRIPRRRRAALAAHRLVLLTAQTPLRRLWGAAYRGVARAGAAYLTWGERDAAAYVRAGVGTSDFLPGLSDVDVTVVLAEDPAGPGSAGARARRRWERLYRGLPVTRLLLDWPRIYDDADLRVLAGASALTYGLDDSGKPAGGGTAWSSALTAAPPAGQEARALPLCDWRSIVCPALPDESFVLLPGDPGDPAVLGAAARAWRTGPCPALRAEGLMIFPADSLEGTRLRAIKCRTTDPVSFALAGGAAVAAFPEVRGWSAEDTARRAVAEHRPRLRAQRGSAGENGSREADGPTLGMFLTAARAALFLESIREGDPVLALTAAETVRQLAARFGAQGAVSEEALGAYREFALHGRQPPAATIAAMGKLVGGLPAYAGHERRAVR